MIDKGNKKRIIQTIKNKQEKIKMFTKGKFLKVNGDLVFQAVHIATGRKVEIKFYSCIVTLIVERKRNIQSMSKNAKLWDCLQELAKMAQNPDY